MVIMGRGVFALILFVSLTTSDETEKGKQGGGVERKFRVSHCQDLKSLHRPKISNSKGIIIANIEYFVQLKSHALRTIINRKLPHAQLPKSQPIPSRF
jgi:hypothetical protein